MKWAFIDYENISNLSKIELSDYTKIIIFLGSKQPKIDFGEIKYDFPIEMTVIQLKATQANNLDFHLSYYLGKFENDAPDNVSFEIISNDNGFAALIAHIQSNGRSCKQIKISSVPSIKNELITSLTSKSIEKRPQKVTSLKNHIASHLHIKGNEVAIQNHLNQLVNEKVIKISGQGIKYKC